MNKNWYVYQDVHYPLQNGYEWIVQKDLEEDFHESICFCHDEKDAETIVDALNNKELAKDD